VSLSDYQTVAVTGASSGIGAAVAHELSRRGLKVHAIARREDRLAQQPGVEIHVLDIRETEALAALLGSLQVDILVNNAGVGRGYGSLVDADPIDIDCTLDTNVRAAVHAVRAVLPSMIERGTGHIVNVGSMAGLYPLSSAVYGASKGALHVLSMDLRLELQGTGIRVNVLSPGPTLTELAAEVVGRDAMIEMGATTPIGHVGEPSEVAAAAAFLASSDSSFMTGSELFTDGGLAQI